MPELNRFHAATAVTTAGSGSVSLEGLRRVAVRNLLMKCSIGVHAHERGAKQRVRVSLSLYVPEDSRALNDALDEVVCYDEIISAVRRTIDAGHVNLIETLAERIARVCLADVRVRHVAVEVEKLDVYPDIESVGVEIFRSNPPA